MNRNILIYLKAIFPSVTTTCNSHILDSKDIHYTSVHEKHFTKISCNTTLKNSGSFGTWKPIHGKVGLILMLLLYNNY